MYKPVGAIPESYQWWLSRQDNKDVYWTSTNPLRYFALCVSGGTLVIGSNCALYPTATPH